MTRNWMSVVEFILLTTFIYILSIIAFVIVNYTIMGRYCFIEIEISFPTLLHFGKRLT